MHYIYNIQYYVGYGQLAKDLQLWLNASSIFRSTERAHTNIKFHFPNGRLFFITLCSIYTNDIYTIFHRHFILRQL